MLQGHGFEPVVRAITDQAAKSLGFGAPTQRETEMAEKIVAAVPGIDRVRLVNSGTEATMSAIRLARGFTSRDIVVKFDGCYHGHSDSLLAKAGSGVLTLGLPNSPGVPSSIARHTMTLPFNDPEAPCALRSGSTATQDRRRYQWSPSRETWAASHPCRDFSKRCGEITANAGALLIFDEVMTGFRIAGGGAQALYGVSADLVTLGKVIGGGLPVGAFGGRADVMNHIAPEGPVYQAGTLSGQPAGDNRGSRLAEYARRRLLQSGWNREPKALTEGTQGDRRQSQCVAVRINSVCGMFSMFFTSERPGSHPSRMSLAATSRVTTASSTRCSTPTSTSLHPHSNPHSFPARTPTRK